MGLRNLKIKIVLSIDGNYTDLHYKLRISVYFLQAIWLNHKAGFTNVSVRKDELPKYSSQRHEITNHNYY